MIEIKITGNDAAETLQQLKELAGSVFPAEVTETVQRMTKEEYEKQLKAINETERAHTSSGMQQSIGERLKPSEQEVQTLERKPTDNDAPPEEPAKTAITDTHPMTEGEVSPMELTELRAIVTKAVQAGKKVKDLLDSTNYKSVSDIPAEQRRDFANAVQAL